MPTVLSYLHFDKPYIAFGRSLFENNKRPFAFNYLDQTYNFFEGDYLLVFDGKVSLALYQFKTDLLLEKNQLAEHPEVVLEMEKRLKAYIQQYNNRMVDDDLTLEGPQVKKSR
jgi:hypothetical protein